ncbi:MAG: O-antigen ligase family protein [Deltaproteobacteria bacterium]|nr:O-antigen ligase family protein [Deltaproteobacteria bacterium]
MEYFFVLYILSGLIKGFLNFFNIPTFIDFTMLTGFIVTMGLFFRVLTHNIFSFDKTSFILLAFFLLFYVWINLTLMYSVSQHYSYQKSLLFLTNLISIIIPLFYKSFQIKKFLKLFALLTPILGVIFLMIFPSVIYKSTDEAQALQSLYLSLPQLCGLCLLLLFLIHDLFPLAVHYLLIIINALVIILSGARGPLVFLILVFIFYFFIRGMVPSHHLSQNITIRKQINLLRFFKILIISGAVVALTVLLVSYVPNMEKVFARSQDRMESLFDFATSGTGDASAEERILRLRYAFDRIAENFRATMVGYGLGSYGIMFEGIDERSYPHNIILEIWFETGLIGVLAFMPFFVFVVYASRHSISDNPIAWCSLFLFLNFMKSGSLVDLRIFFCFLVIMVLLSRKQYAKEMPNYNVALPIRTQES